ncbi:uncharacterized protein ALTATR162_LOCUS2830 [Alternaria atra]|uniref:Uncharacterized protein n=1 Tax=Alternaria atra TaxID=119953 RepID=A0A8J2HYF5_9PLEO|nr:uncharacterized protein ALTATR162_LOCUS2830 [Alternaria atra]CAG5152579.1 unnamed protein product [Alternaria atra]
MFPTAPIRTAPDTTSLMQGGVSTSFATVTKTDTIVKMPYRTSTVTVSSTVKYTTTHLRAIVPPSLLKNVTAAYNIVDKQNAATETYAIKWALGLALTTGAALAWHIRKTPSPPAPPGVDRLRWEAIKYHVHNWLYEKLRSNAGLRKELEDAKKKLEDYETLQEARTDHSCQTEKLSEGARSVQDGTLQQTIDFNRMPGEATSLYGELKAEKEKATELQQALKVEKDSAMKLQHRLQKTTEELGRSIVRVREARRHTVESGVHRKESDDTGATVASLREQLDAALQEAFKAKAKAASMDQELQVAQNEQNHVSDE